MSAMPGLGEEVSEVYKQDGSGVAVLLFERAMIVFGCAPWLTTFGRVL